MSPDKMEKIIGSQRMAIQSQLREGEPIDFPREDDEDHAEVTATPDNKPGRYIREASEAERRELKELRERIAKLEATLNAAAWEINEHNKWLFQFREAFEMAYLHPLYRFLMWLHPAPIPKYRRGRTVPYIVLRDRRPT